MFYRGYQILAEVETYDFYGIDEEDGSLTQVVEEGMGISVTGYLIRSTFDSYEESVSSSECDVATLKELVDDVIKERAKEEK